MEGVQLVSTAEPGEENPHTPEVSVRTQEKLSCYSGIPRELHVKIFASPIGLGVGGEFNMADRGHWELNVAILWT
jgi:hypothetical protein